MFFSYVWFDYTVFVDEDKSQYTYNYSVPQILPCPSDKFRHLTLRLQYLVLLMASLLLLYSSNFMSEKSPKLMHSSCLTVWISQLVMYTLVLPWIMLSVPHSNTNTSLGIPNTPDIHLPAIYLRISKALTARLFPFTT